MSNLIEIPSNTTLLRLVMTNREMFYNQDWYFDEEFANTDIGGIWILGDITVSLPAAVWIYLFLRRNAWAGTLEHQYVWTSDVDNAGNRVYIGNTSRKGMQIHRHLDIAKLNFAN